MWNVIRQTMWGWSVAAVAVGLATAAMAQDAPAPGLKTLAVSDVKVAATLDASVKKAGHGDSLGRVREALDGQLIDRFNQTRKFKIIARSDLDSLMKEQGFANSGNVDTSDPKAAKQFMIKGAQYIVVTSVDDFQDFSEEATFATGEKAYKRQIHLSAVGKVYDTTSGELLDSTNFQISEKELGQRRNFSTTNGELSDALLLQTSREMADKIANRVVDVIYPARVLAVTGRQVTINRGDGTGIAAGQVWTINALGQELKDPDTGEVLGREEMQIAKVRVTDVLPKMSKADIIEIVEGSTVTAGAVLRLEEAKTAP